MNTTDESSHKGHRNRLRDIFLNTPTDLSEKDLLELLLTYAIPRKDVSSLASRLMDRFSSIEDILSAPSDILSTVPDIGESTIIFLKVINTIFMNKNSGMIHQPALFVSKEKIVRKKQEVRVFANDEIATSIKYLPMASEHESFLGFKSFLENHLPYNSFETRQRRANYILGRFYPDGDLNTLLTFFMQKCKSQDALKSVIFYHLAKAEPLLAKVVDEFIYPALPLGKIGREQLREFILNCLPLIGESSQKNALRSIFYSYTLLGLGREDDDNIKFRLHTGQIEAFVYILVSDNPEPGIYSFDKLFEGPLHRWLLWDKEWIRKQLYVLRDMGVISKVSEIDTIRQFSIEFGQRDFLERFFMAIEKQNSVDEKAGDKKI